MMSGSAALDRASKNVSNLAVIFHSGMSHSKMPMCVPYCCFILLQTKGILFHQTVDLFLKEL